MTCFSVASARTSASFSVMSFLSTTRTNEEKQARQPTRDTLHWSLAFTCIPDQLAGSADRSEDTRPQVPVERMWTGRYNVPVSFLQSRLCPFRARSYCVSAVLCEGARRVRVVPAAHGCTFASSEAAPAQHPRSTHIWSRRRARCDYERSKRVRQRGHMDSTHRTGPLSSKPAMSSATPNGRLCAACTVVR